MFLKRFQSKFSEYSIKDNCTSLLNHQSSVNKIFSIYKPYIFGFCGTNSYNDNKKVTSLSGSFTGITNMESKHLSTLDDLLKYESSLNSEFTVEQIIHLLQNNLSKLTDLRGQPTIAYLSNINQIIDPSGNTSINDEDVLHFISLINSIDAEILEINVILHSNGGLMETAHNLVEILRQRFQRVNFLIPLNARSAATLMTMSGDEIIMTPESCLGPFDVQSTICNGKITLPAMEMVKFLKSAENSFVPINIFAPKKIYECVQNENITGIKLDCINSIKKSKKYATNWLRKYMFAKNKQDKTLFYKIIDYIYLYYKTKKIILYFMNTKTHMSHSHPIMYPEIKNFGLNVKVAEKELLALLRENYILSYKLFEQSKGKMYKIYLSKDTHTYTYNKTKS